MTFKIERWPTTHVEQMSGSWQAVAIWGKLDTLTHLLDVLWKLDRGELDLSGAGGASVATIWCSLTMGLCDGWEDDVEDEVFEVSEEAIAADKDGWHKVEDGIATKLIENIDFGRISAQAAKQVIIQKVREAERSKITQKYESLVGEVISGQVKRINRDFLLLEIEEDLKVKKVLEKL